MNSYAYDPQANDKNELAQRVSDAVGYQLAGALLGYAVVVGVNKTTPLRTPWWVGVAVGAAIGASAEWSKEKYK